MLSSILDWPQSAKRFTVLAVDTVLCLFAMWLAFSLRLDALHRPEKAQWLVYALAPALALPIFARFGLYRAIFRYTGMAALYATGVATATYGLALLVVLFALQWKGIDNIIPRSVGILQPLLFLMLVGASRAFAQSWLLGLTADEKLRKARLLIYGAGDAGVQTAAGISTGGEFVLLGFIDDDARKVGRSINHLPVYSPAKVAEVVKLHQVTDILLAMPSVPRDRRNAIIEQLGHLPVHIRTLPGLADLANGRVSVQDIRELDIEDLLGREPVAPSPELLARNLTGKKVLVTGAGGSIGSELCRQIVQQNPVELVLVDHNEFGLFSIHQELHQICSLGQHLVRLTPVLGSVTNYDRMTVVFQTHRPDTVYHAAAYKHVPLVESNPVEGILNNVFGTLNTARVAMECRVSHFVLISTDKAVRPTNVMGASKRIAELILQALADTQDVCFEPGLAPVSNQTLFAMVRFGNVLDSSGSVVPTFRRQLAAGGPITVTHSDITRYFMTIPEAAQLVLQAGAMAEGGDVFLLEMGEPVKILDLARRMVTLSGLKVRESPNDDGDIDIAISGLRPGEKLYEELLIGDNASPTAHARIMKGREEFIPWSSLSASLQQLRSAIQSNAADSIRALLLALVRDYQPSHLMDPDAATPSAQPLPTAEAFC